MTKMEELSMFFGVSQRHLTLILQSINYNNYCEEVGSVLSKKEQPYDRTGYITVKDILIKESIDSLKEGNKRMIKKAPKYRIIIQARGQHKYQDICCLLEILSREKKKPIKKDT